MGTNLIAPWNIVAREEQPEVTILHVSDLHFGPPFVPDVAEDVLRIAHQLSLTAVVVSGDLTQRATRDQFLAAKEFLGRFPQVPTLVIPGNHDVPLYRIVERLKNPLALYKEIINGELNPVLRLNSAVIVGLDSTAPRSAISNGRIHAWQLELCERAFADASDDTIKIVVAHHHFAPLRIIFTIGRCQNRNGQSCALSNWTLTLFWAATCTGRSSATRSTSIPACIVSAASLSPSREPRPPVEVADASKKRTR